MIQLSINLPNHRLCLRLVKRRRASFEKSFIPDVGVIMRTRVGNKLSRFFRHVFEHRNIKKIFGANLAAILIATSFVPAQTYAETKEAEENFVDARDKVVLATERVVQYPVEKVIITQGFKFYHPGVDFDGVTGDRVKPISSGSIGVVSKSRFAYGNSIVVNHEKGLSSLYAHLSKIYVKEGEYVTTRTVLGEMGATGRASGDHLHLEVYSKGRPVNPSEILPPQ